MQASSRPFRSAPIDEGPDAPAPPLYPRKLLVACGFAAPIVFVGTFLIEGATRPGYDSWAEFVSLLCLLEWHDGRHDPERMVAARRG
jgi:hypothetical protein